MVSCVQHQLVLKKYKDLVNKTHWEVKISHCYHKPNKVLDKLANLVTFKELGFIFLQDLSLELRDILYVDNVDVA